ncbi:MAG TPA: hypothetical protein VIU62_08695, partial [Chloroflexota bacterium]
MARLLARSEISRWTLWLAVFAPLTVVYLLTVRINPADMSADPAAVTPSAWQIAHFGTPRLPSSVQPFSYHNDWLIPSGSGQVVSNREPGLVLLAVPFYWVMSSAGVGNVLPAGIAAALCSSAAMATLALVARRLVPAKTAVAVGLLAGVATTTWSVSGTSLWPHGPDQLYLAVSMEALALGASGYAGLAFAGAILTRPPLAIVAAVTGVW